MSDRYDNPSKILLSLKKGVKKITPQAHVVTTLLSIIISSISALRNPEFPLPNTLSEPITLERNRKNLETPTNTININVINININKDNAH